MKTSRTASSREYKTFKMPAPPSEGFAHVNVSRRHVVGVDVFLETTQSPEAIVDGLAKAIAGSPLHLLTIANRGTTVYPSSGTTNIALVDHFRCRFVGRDGADATDAQIMDLLQRISTTYSWMHVEKLQQFDGVDAFSKSQGG